VNVFDILAKLFIGSGSVYGTLDVGTSATLVKVGASQLSERSAILVVNDSAQDIYVGFDASVTTANGIPIKSNQERQFAMNPNDNVPLYAVAGSATTIRVVEAK